MRRSDSIAWSIDFTTARSGAGIAFRYHNPSILQSIALTYLTTSESVGIEQTKLSFNGGEWLI
ncbi:MAG: hypothetical protein AAFR25_10560 [Cyanobacteria bacterium J06629_19]